MHVTALIPAKGESRRLPRKNLVAFGDSTLLGHKITQLKRCARIDQVVVGSDCDDVLEEAHRHGAGIRRRDAWHCDESVCSANAMIRNLAAMVETDLVVWAHCTNPLVTADIYDAAIAAYLAARPGHDSLCSVDRVQRHAWRRRAVDHVFGRPIRRHLPDNFNPWAERHPLAAELEPYFVQNGAIFIQPHAQMLANSYFYGADPLLFEIEPPFGWDIDTPRDLAIARALDAALRTEQVGGAA